jgi:transposase-like protein
MLSARPPSDRRRWTEQDARRVLAALDRSGQSVRAFAEGHGIDPQRLYLWRRRFASVAGGDATTFQELTVPPSRASSVDRGVTAAFEIVLASGVVVRVPASFDMVSLERLLHVLTRAHAC